MSKTHIISVKPMSQADSGSINAFSDENANLPDGMTVDFVFQVSTPHR